MLEMMVWSQRYSRGKFKKTKKCQNSLRIPSYRIQQEDTTFRTFKTKICCYYEGGVVQLELSCTSLIDTRKASQQQSPVCRVRIGPTIA